MLKYIVAYAATAAVFFTIDFIWLSRVAQKFYADQIGTLLLEKPNIAAAAGFYLIYIVGIIIFAIAPAMKSGSANYALLFGALFGFFAYATYDMTNFATLKNWSAYVVIVDIAWGTFITGISAYLGFLITRASGVL